MGHREQRSTQPSPTTVIWIYPAATIRWSFKSASAWPTLFRLFSAAAAAQPLTYILKLDLHQFIKSQSPIHFLILITKNKNVLKILSSSTFSDIYFMCCSKTSNFAWFWLDGSKKETSLKRKEQKDVSISKSQTFSNKVRDWRHLSWAELWGEITRRCKNSCVASPSERQTSINGLSWPDQWTERLNVEVSAQFRQC